MFIALLIFISIIIMWKVSSKKGSAYKEKLTPTMRFILAAGANTAQVADCDAIDIGGNPADNWAKKHMRKLLKSGWNIKDAEDLKETISWLFNEGHNEDCMELAKQYKADPESVKIKKLFKSSEEHVKTMLDTIATKYEKQGILAWDLCRICNVAGWGFLAQYITYEEAIELSVQACKLLQENYSSWDDMMESYFLGLYYWNKDSLSTHNRKQWYEKSKKDADSIYNIPWDTILSPEDVIPPRKK